MTIIDPADKHRALATQGAMLGQHQQALQKMQQEVAALKQSVDRLQQPQS